ncbi:MAG TPA: hypothetical protein VGQ32_05220, partial [Thermoanaerobaculia bacterium]|nr:hypothetical protein [Thermoanaerobaculia bacterium]
MSPTSATNATNLAGWVARHPYLEPLARWTAAVDAAAAGIETPRVSIPAWDDYAADFAAGLPLLRSEAAGVDLEPGGAVAVELVASLSTGPAAGRPLAALAELDAQLSRMPDAARRIGGWLLGDESFDPVS